MFARLIGENYLGMFAIILAQSDRKRLSDKLEEKLERKQNE